MYRVHFSRAERDDPLLLAKQAIDEAIFEREARRLGLEVEEHPDSGEDNCVSWLIDVPAKLALAELLGRLRDCGLPLLVVDVPEGELEEWALRSELAAHFDFQAE